MSGIQASDAAGEIDQAIAIDVFDDRAFGFGDKYRRGVKSALRHGRVTALHQLLRTRSWNRGA